MKNPRLSGAGCGETRTSRSNREGRDVIVSLDSTKKYIHKSYGKKGEAVVSKNIAAVEAALEHLHRVEIPTAIATEAKALKPPIPDTAPAFVREVLGATIARVGDYIPVSVLPCDGTYPSGTSKWEKRNVGHEIPVWEQDVCVQCGKCVMVCPHSVIRSKVYQRFMQ